MLLLLLLWLLLLVVLVVVLLLLLLLLVGVRALEDKGGRGPDPATQEDPQALELWQVVPQATDRARRVKVARP